MPRPLIITAAVFALAVASGLIATDPTGRPASASHDGLAMDAMSIDMDPFGIPANTGASLGSRENAARINENDLLDADEDLVDSLIIDVTATNVPFGNAATDFQYDLTYATPPAPGLCIVDEEASRFFFDGVIDFSDPVFGGECDGFWFASVHEIGVPGSFGSGTLHRLTLETQPGVIPGVYNLELDDAGHRGLGDLLNFYPPNAINNAFICIDANCDDVDGDGVPIPTDVCPETAPGATVDSSGCSQDVYDEDLDGVCDPGQTSIFCAGSDQCPDTIGSPVDPNGCSQSQVDSDGDGVCDPGASSTLCAGSDQCPDTTESPVDANGCSQSQVDADADGVCDPGASSTFCTGEDACPAWPGELSNLGCPPPGPPAVGGIAGLLDAGDSPPPSQSGTSTAAYPWVALAAVIPILAAGGWLTVRLVRARRRIE